jgi:hypothetical protein
MFSILRLAVGVSQHGNLEDKLKMAFDIYGKFLFLFLISFCL